MSQDSAQFREHLSDQLHGGSEVQVSAAESNSAHLHRCSWTCQAAEAHAHQMQKAQGGLLLVSADDTCHDVGVEQRCHHKTMLVELLISTFGGLSL